MKWNVVLVAAMSWYEGVLVEVIAVALADALFVVGSGDSKREPYYSRLRGRSGYKYLTAGYGQMEKKRMYWCSYRAMINPIKHGKEYHYTG